MGEVYGDYTKCVLRYTLAGWDDQINVINLQMDGGPALSLSDAENIAAAFEAWFTAHAGAVSSSYTLADITIKDQRAAISPGYIFSVGIPGGSAANLLPPGTALVMTLHTGYSGKAFRGRVFLGGFCEDVNVAGGTLGSAEQASIEGNFGDLVAELATLGFPMAVVSKRFDNADRPTAVVTPVATFQADQQWDRQKRRGS